MLDKEQWEQVIEYMKAAKGFDSFLLDRLTLVEVLPTGIIFEMTVAPEHLNVFSSLHGGVISSLVDLIGALSITARSGDPNSGVSSDLSVSFCRNAPVGSKIRIISMCHKAGKNLGFSTTQIVDVASGKIIATGSHTKFLGQSSASKL